MEIGKLYKSKTTEIIVECININSERTFVGRVESNDSYYPLGYVHNDWDIENFVPLNESAKSIQIGGNHYSKYVIQPTEFIHRNNVPFIEGNIIKYVLRHKSKNGIEDLKKAKHYIDLLIEFEYTKNETY